MPEVYWIMRNGQKISIDDMDEQHVRNSLKMILRKLEKTKAELMTRVKIISEKKTEVTLNGDMAQQWNDMNEDADMFDAFDAFEDPYLPQHDPEHFIGEDRPIKCPPNADISEEKRCPYLHCTKCSYALIRTANSYVCFKCDAVYFLKETGR